MGALMVMVQKAKKSRKCDKLSIKTFFLFCIGSKGDQWKFVKKLSKKLLNAFSALSRRSFGARVSFSSILHPFL